MQKELADTVLDVDAVGNELAGKSNSVAEGFADEDLVPFGPADLLANGERSDAKADENSEPVGDESRGANGAPDSIAVGDDSDHPVVEPGVEQASTVKYKRGPRGPTPQEREAHELTHAEFRDWCAHCVRGRGHNIPHLRSHDVEDRSVPILTWNYSFMGESRTPRR